MKKILSVLLSVAMLMTMLSTMAIVSSADNDYSGPYTADGIYAVFDGTKPDGVNTGDTGSTWNSVIGDAYATLNGGSFTGSGYLTAQQTNPFSSDIVDLINSDEYTVEVHFGDFTSKGNSYNTILNSTNDQFALFRNNSQNKLVFKRETGSTTRPTVESFTAADFVDATVTVTAKVGDSCKIYVNGVEKASVSNYTKLEVADFFFGQADGNKWYQAEYKSIRFYSKALDAEDIAENYEQDMGITDYTADFDLGSASDKIEETSFESLSVAKTAQDKTVTLPSVTLTSQAQSEGYEFDGWKSSRDNEVYESGSYTLSRSVTFTAQINKKYVVSYAGANINAIANQKVTQGEATTLKTPEVADGYYFDGWLCSADNKLYPANYSYTPEGAVTFTAQTSAKPSTQIKEYEGTNYKVSYERIYDASYGVLPSASSGASGRTEITTGDSIALSATTDYGRGAQVFNIPDGIDTTKIIGVRLHIAGDEYMANKKFTVGFGTTDELDTAGQPTAKGDYFAYTNYSEPTYAITESGETAEIKWLNNLNRNTDGLTLHDAAVSSSQNNAVKLTSSTTYAENLSLSDVSSIVVYYDQAMNGSTYEKHPVYIDNVELIMAELPTYYAKYYSLDDGGWKTYSSFDYDTADDALQQLATDVNSETTVDNEKQLNQRVYILGDYTFTQTIEFTKAVFFYFTEEDQTTSHTLTFANEDADCAIKCTTLYVLGKKDDYSTDDNFVVTDSEGNKTQKTAKIPFFEANGSVALGGYLKGDLVIKEDGYSGSYGFSVLGATNNYTGNNYLDGSLSLINFGMIRVDGTSAVYHGYKNNSEHYGSNGTLHITGDLKLKGLVCSTGQYCDNFNLSEMYINGDLDYSEVYTDTDYINDYKRYVKKLFSLKGSQTETATASDRENSGVAEGKDQPDVYSTQVYSGEAEDGDTYYNDAEANYEFRAAYIGGDFINNDIYAIYDNNRSQNEDYQDYIAGNKEHSNIAGKVLQGASLRIARNDTAGVSGLRFKTQVNADLIETAKEQGFNVVLGTRFYQRQRVENGDFYKKDTGENIEDAYIAENNYGKYTIFRDIYNYGVCADLDVDGVTLTNKAGTISRQTQIFRTSTNVSNYTSGGYSVVYNSDQYDKIVAENTIGYLNRADGYTTSNTNVIAGSYIPSSSTASIKRDVIGIGYVRLIDPYTGTQMTFYADLDDQGITEGNESITLLGGSTYNRAFDFSKNARSTAYVAHRFLEDIYNSISGDTVEDKYIVPDDYRTTLETWANNYDESFDETYSTIESEDNTYDDYKTEGGN